MATNTNSRLKQIEAEAQRMKSAADRIRQANANFKKMTAPQRRVAIAKDVLLQLDAEKYRANSGSYILLDESIEVPENTETQICEIDMPNCETCARGAMFLSSIRLFNGINFAELTDDGGVLEGGTAIDRINVPDNEDYEEKFFSRKQIEMIETVFETDKIGIDNDGLSETTIVACRLYARELGNKDDVRLRSIMNNIIKNKGEFVVPPQYIKEAKEELRG